MTYESKIENGRAYRMVIIVLYYQTVCMEAAGQGFFRLKNSQNIYGTTPGRYRTSPGKRHRHPCTVSVAL